MPGVVRVGGGIILAAIVGFVLARSAGSGSKDSGAATTLGGHVSAANYTLRYPSGWARLSGAPTGLQPPLTGAVALKPSSAGRELVVGSSSLSAAAAASGALPRSLLALLAERPRPDRVTLGSLRWDRYAGLTPRGQGVTESLYVLPTTAGTIGAACVARSASSAFTADCERVLGSLRLTSGTVLATSVDATYASALNTVLSRLNTARAAGGPGLRSPSLGSRARAATRLSAAHSQAATAAQGLTGNGTAAADRALVAALDQTATAYRRLATAIRAHNLPGYRRAETDLNVADAALQRAYAGLRALGYRIG